MVEYKAFALAFAALLIAIGLPMLLFGLFQYASSPGMGFGILAISVFMLLMGGFFIVILITQK